MKYPNGRKRAPLAGNRSEQNNLVNQYSNRGMTLEDDLNSTNEFYLQADKAIIHKKPTPVQIVNVNYPKRSAAVITEAYFKQASTTDYNGLYRNKYVDFEAKETKNKTSFPLANIHEHQIRHMEAVVKHGGICFLILRFTVHDETYLFPAERLFPYWKKRMTGGKKSIPYEVIKEEGYIIPFQYQARLDYLRIIDKLYF
ncbi:Holliday junction resolvase RecU [Virgibacillus xinjiangensis]|uniref:Holliday junction resolvase RecU n=1 Tax=Virgibacillus xinjiangensis TaxID=393090 RepID=A0ABV7CRA4_9BACI